MSRLSRNHPGDKELVRAEAIKRLDDVIEKLPLQKSQIEIQENQLKKSTLLKEILGASEQREFRDRVRRALADLVTENVI